MNELERIVREAEALDGAYLLATVVRVSGSSYRRPGARMLVAGERWVSGCVSGGCLEGDVMMRGAHRTRDGAVVVTYDSTRDQGDEPWGVGLGCNGIVDVLLERVDPGARSDALVFAAACFAAETTGTLVTVIRSARPGVTVGARIALGPACMLQHTVTDPDVRRALEHAARGPAGVVELDQVTALVEAIAPSPQLFVLGSGHDAAPIITLAKSIGFRVTVADRAIRERSRLLGADRAVSTGGDLDRARELIDAAAEAYVVIMHHHNATDRDALAMTLASRARYIGVLGPARRTKELLAELGRTTDDPRLHAPIGLDVGAETPEQIALAIVAEVQAVRSHARGGMLRARARALHADLATIVLAAGGSRRLGRPKQLVELEGRPLVQRVAATCVASEAGPVGVVLGSGAALVADALGALRVAHIVNDEWPQGIASSVRAGVRWAQATNAGALLVVLADQPLLDVAHITALRDAWLAGAPVVASRYEGVAAVPAIFDRSRWPALEQLEGDQGAGRLLRSADITAIDWAHGAVDVDTTDDVRRIHHLGQDQPQ